MNQVLRDFLDQFVVVYLDDIVVYSNTLEDHLEHLTIGIELNLPSADVQFHGYGNRRFAFYLCSLSSVCSWGRRTTSGSISRYQLIYGQAVGVWKRPHTFVLPFRDINHTRTTPRQKNLLSLLDCLVSSNIESVQMSSKDRLDSMPWLT